MNSKQLLALRQRLRLTQQAFAQLIGVSSASISRWERGLHSIDPLGVLLLTLVRGTVDKIGADTAVAVLHDCRGSHLKLVRMMVGLEK